jgi:hypothetical protein
VSRGCSPRRRSRTAASASTGRGWAGPCWTCCARRGSRRACRGSRSPGATTRSATSAAAAWCQEGAGQPPPGLAPVAADQSGAELARRPAAGAGMTDVPAEGASRGERPVRGVAGAAARRPRAGGRPCGAAGGAEDAARLVADPPASGAGGRGPRGCAGGRRRRAARAAPPSGCHPVGGRRRPGRSAPTDPSTRPRSTRRSAGVPSWRTRRCRLSWGDQKEDTERTHAGASLLTPYAAARTAATAGEPRCGRRRRHLSPFLRCWSRNACVRFSASRAARQSTPPLPLSNMWPAPL